MCYEDGQLMAYVDGELPAEQRAEVESHAAACAECAARVARLRDERAFAADALTALQPAAEVVPLAARSARAARPAGVRDRRAAAPRFGMRPSQLAAAAAVVLALGSLAFAPVRSAVASALQIFRVQKVQTVTISRADLQQLAAAVKKGGHVDLKAFGEAWIDGSASKVETVTAAQAQAALDLPVKLPSSQHGEPTLLLSHGQTYKFKLNVSAINEALTAYGSDRGLPESLDGKVFSIQVAPILLARYPAPAGSVVAGMPNKYNGVYVGQGHSPQLVVPDGVDPNELREVLLNLPILPANIRSQIAAVKDWQSTLLIPNVDGTAHDVTIDSVSAVVVTPASAARDARKKMAGLPPVGDNATVIWNDNGVVRAVGGPINEEAAINLAKSVMK